MSADDEPQILKDMRRCHPRNAVPDDQGGNAAARRMWNPRPLGPLVVSPAEFARRVAAGEIDAYGYPLPRPGQSIFGHE